MAFARISSTVLVLAMTVSPTAWADDAYDDEERPELPEEDTDEAEEEDEASEALESGGLKAPGTLPESGDKGSEIEEELDRSDEKDAGRGLEFFWLSGEIGFQSMGLATFAGEAASGSGLVYGGAGGLRLLYFTLGARFRRASFADFSPWSLVAEAGLRVPLGKFEPYGTFSGGYAGVADVEGVGPTGGLDLRLGGGLDLYLSDSFSIGGAVSGDLLFLSTGGESSTGAAFTVSLLLGLHF